MRRRHPLLPSGRTPVLTALLLIVAGGAALAQFSFMRNMYEGPVVLPQVAPRVPVEDTIAVDGARIRDRLESMDLANPVPNTADARQQGAWLYEVYCEVCHGATGQGDGQIAEHFRRMPSLSTPNVQAYTDGWLYSIIREGGFNMPPFAQSMSVPERWTLVHHLRTFNTE